MQIVMYVCCGWLHLNRADDTDLLIELKTAQNASWPKSKEYEIKAMLEC